MDKLDKKEYTIQGRNVNYMDKKDIEEYLGITDNADTKLKREIIEQAEEIEKQYKGEYVDYCLKEDYGVYIDNLITIFVADTKDLRIYKVDI